MLITKCLLRLPLLEKVAQNTSLITWKILFRKKYRKKLEQNSISKYCKINYNFL